MAFGGGAGVTEVLMKFTSDASGAIKGIKGLGGNFDQTMQTMRRTGTVVFAAVTGSLTAMAMSTATLGDHFQKLSQQTGLSAEALSSLRFAAEQGGSSVEALEKGVLRMSRSMYEAAQGVGEYADTYKTLGIEVTNTDGTMRSTEEVMMDVADRFADMEDGAKKTALAQEIFGRAGAELIPMLNEGSAGIKEMMEEAERLGITFTDEAAQASADFKDRLNELKLSFSGIKNQIGIVVIEAVTPYIEKIKEVIVQIVGWMKEHKGLTEAILKVVAVIGGAGGLLTVIGFLAPAISGAIALISGPVGIVAGLVALGIIIAKLVNTYFPEFSSRLKEIVSDSLEWWGIIEDVDKTLREHKDNIWIAEHAIEDMKNGVRTADQAYKDLSDTMKDQIEPFNGTIDAYKKLEEWLKEAKGRTEELDKKTKGLSETFDVYSGVTLPNVVTNVDQLATSTDKAADAVSDFHKTLDDAFYEFDHTYIPQMNNFGNFAVGTMEDVTDRVDKDLDDFFGDLDDYEADAREGWTQTTEHMSDEWDKTFNEFSNVLTRWLGDDWGGFLSGMIDLFGSANPHGALGDMRKEHDNFLATMSGSGSSWLGSDKGWKGFLDNFKGMFGNVLNDMKGMFGDWFTFLSGLLGQISGWIGGIMGLLNLLGFDFGGGPDTGPGGGVWGWDWHKMMERWSSHPPKDWMIPFGGTSYQHGGIIPEYVRGIGASGRMYEFHGPEMVTPMGKGGSPITVNINYPMLLNGAAIKTVTHAVQKELTQKLADLGLVSFAGA